MKTKNKMIAFVEIAIVLGLLFFVAMPAIAAEEDDYVLGVYGNANEDDTIDMRDLTYVKLIFFGKKPETELADAKYDGKINPLDFIQIKLIIVGKEKELTVIDDLGEAVTISKPVERVVHLEHNAYIYETLRAIDASDRIVGTIDAFVKEGGWLYSEKFFPELIEIPSVGTYGYSLDYEMILSLEPDVAHVAGVTFTEEFIENFKEKLPGISVIHMSAPYASFTENTKKFGYIYDKRAEAKEYINWHNNRINTIEERTEGLSEDEKPLVLLIWWGYGTPPEMCISSGKAPEIQQVLLAGGKSLGAELEPQYSFVDPEWIIEQNPDIIILMASTSTAISRGGYDVDDPSEMIASREDFMSLPEFAEVNAVKNGDVYMINLFWVNGGSIGLLAGAYYAKWFHPELFEDMNPQVIHQEYIDKFCGIDYDVTEHGVFVYHPEKHPDGK